mmetsp:Transcript_33089/g.75655  ORF Transcript_33089/g.75655 Transcript_33089/m.75655 type:complete len:82 (-) Transcript_33089:99-344(-)
MHCAKVTHDLPQLQLVRFLKPKRAHKYHQQRGGAKERKEFKNTKKFNSAFQNSLRSKAEKEVKQPVVSTMVKFENGVLVST